jgi:hypothetical protein
MAEWKTSGWPSRLHFSLLQPVWFCSRLRGMLPPAQCGCKAEWGRRRHGKLASGLG